MFNFPLYSIFYFGSGLLLLTIAATIWSRRPAQGLVPFVWFLLSASLISICVGLEAGAVFLSTKILITKIVSIFVTTLGALWLFFALEYSECSWWKRPRYYLVLFIIPLIALILIWTNELHHLIWERFYLIDSNLGPITASDLGRLFFLSPIYQYCLFLTGIIIILRYALKQPPALRRQVYPILGGLLIPMAASILYVLGISPIKGLNFTPFCIFVTALIYFFTVFRFRFLNILPVAYSTLIENIPDCILILNAQNRLIKTNPAAESLPIFSANQTGKPLEQVWPELYTGLQASQNSKQFELSILKDDKPIYFNASQTITKNNRGSTVGKLVVLRNITELKNTQKELEAEIQNRSQYTRALVHELRTPLTSIIACADILIDIAKVPEEQSLSHNIRRAAGNLDQRVTELFELARGEMGLIKIELLKVDIGLLAEEVVAEIAPVAAQKGLSLTGDYVKNLIVMGDKSRLRQVLSNLLSNAIKFTEKGGIRVKMSVLDNRYSLIQVTDSGRGIAPDQMETLFDPYRRRNPAGQSKTGMGIGLALSKIFIELHKGTIWAESVTGKGTTVSFKLPLVQE